MDGESRPRTPPRPRRQLRDISHLYISTRRRVSGVRPRTLRLGFVANGDRLAKADVCGNMAVQLARLGKRTLVLDLDPWLPNAGFHLGLEPDAYMAHLLAEPRPRVERGLLGLRIVEGLATHTNFEEFVDESLQREIQESDCVIVNLPTLDEQSDKILARLAALLRGSDALRAGETTMSEVGTRSPMFGNWLAASRARAGARQTGARQSATRPGATPQMGPRQFAGDAPLDALLYVHADSDAATAHGAVSRLRDALPSSSVHVLAWGDAGSDLELRPWARIRPHRLGFAARQPLSSLYPEHPAARLYQNLVQALLAGLAGRGGADA